MKKKSISVIIPNYNYAHFLKRRLESIIYQTIKPDEIILLDDCSTDNSVEIAGELLKKSGIKYTIITNETNQGVFKQWLKGIELVQNNYFWIAEADDYCELTFLEELLPAFEDPNVVLSYSDSMQVDENQCHIQLESKVKEDYFKLTRWSSEFINNGVDEIVNYLAFFCTIPNVSGVVIRKEAVNLNKILAIDMYKKVGDWFFYILLLSSHENYKLAYTANCLNYFTRHQNSVSINTDNGILLNREVLQVIRYLLLNFKFTNEQLGYLFYRILSFMGWCTYDMESQRLLFSLLDYFPNIILMNEICKVIQGRDYIINNLTTSLEELDKKCIDKDIESNSLNTKIKELEGNCIDKDIENNSLNTKIKELERNCINKDADNSYLRLTIYEMQTSRSWKLTKPLRYIGQIFRRLFF